MSIGSSPHTRGLHISRCWCCCHLGIIPAHAGFTTRPRRRRWRRRDHPRTRGVYFRQGMPSDLLNRIIPAHAGFTGNRGTGEQGSSDHPRTRGVYILICDAPRMISGSSPHTRGLRSGSARRFQGLGIIPAHAGFTCYDHVREARQRDHPRTRGVYRSGGVGGAATDGSSPHTRGLHTQDQDR